MPVLEAAGRMMSHSLGVWPMLCYAQHRLPPSVGLLLTIHLCLFTIIGMQLFTFAEKVSTALAGGGAHRTACSVVS